MLNIEKTHPWVASLALSAIAEYDTKSEINGALVEAFGLPKVLRFVETKKDLMFTAHYGDTLYAAVSGTRNTRGWLRNLNYFPRGGWHRGFVDSAKDCFPPLLDSWTCAGSGTKTVIIGHSAGHAIGLRLAYDLSRLTSKVEHFGFCGPQAVNKEGREQLRKQKLHSTSITIGKQDQVDDIAKLVGGVDYSTTITLPSDGKPGLCK
ncbi:MAG: hypothetical protein WC455_31355, partial [Dehalococcoidia bacterium]